MYRRTYRKRYAARRYGTKRRTGYKRRSYGRKSTFISNQKGTAANVSYRRSRLSWRRKKNMLWNASSVLDKNRSYQAAQSFLTPGANANMQINSIKAMSAAFWTLSGGAPANNFNAYGGSHLFIRGGLLRLRCSNGPYSPTFLNVWLIRTTANLSGPPTSAIRYVGWDPSTDPDAHQSYKLIRSWDTLLGSNDAWEVTHKLPSQRIGIDDYNANMYSYYWVIGSSVQGTTTANQIDVVNSFSLSFTGDNIGING